jgi:pyruvate kinase
MTISLQSPSDIYEDTLKQLLTEVMQLRHDVEEHASYRLLKYTAYFHDGIITKSACNLAHYLALRQYDLRHLQDRLAQAGLSSLGRSEASVMSTLNSVIEILQRATAKSYSADEKKPTEYGFNRGQQLLDQHSIELFGPFHTHSKVHVMVTLATETAWDYELILGLLTKGMTCARINCAHDNATIWRQMIRNVRRAETETGKICRILMDLAGHKIRTGAVKLEPAVHHIKIKKNVYGQSNTKTQLILTTLPHNSETNDENSALFHLHIPENLFNALTPQSRLSFLDARNKQRYFIVDKQLSATKWLVNCHQSSYLMSACTVQLTEANAPDTDDKNITYTCGEFSGKPMDIRLNKNDCVILTENDIEGGPAEYDAKGNVLHPAHIGCTLSNFSEKLTIGQPVWIDDGKLGGIVETIDTQGVWVRITQARSQGVSIQSDKGINFPDSDLKLSPLSTKDLLDLDFAATHADLIGFSFVEKLSDMEYLVAELAKRNASDIPIIAKIETNLAVKNLPDIILGTIGKHSLGIMIARGDLAVELGSARLAEIQEELLWVCEAAHVPVIWATQVLESIAKKGVKSRPEFTDAAMAVRAECVMLNKGPYILDAIEALINVMIRMQEHQRKKFSRLRALHW